MLASVLFAVNWEAIGLVLKALCLVAVLVVAMVGTIMLVSAIGSLVVGAVWLTVKVLAVAVSPLLIVVVG